MPEVTIAIAEHQWPLIVVGAVIVAFALGWGVFAWSR